MDINSDGDSYRTEPTVFNSNADSDTNYNTYSNTNSTAELENTYKVSA